MLIWFEYVEAGTVYSLRLDAVTCYERKIKNGVLETGKRGYLYRHVLSRRVKYEIEVAADELYIEDNANFMTAFWYASEQRISFADTTERPDDETFILVDSGDGEGPEEYLEGDKSFPNWSFELTEMSSRLWNSDNQIWEPQYIA